MHRSHRLRKNEQFQEVFQKGNSAANKQFVLYSAKQEGQAAFRAGISVSKKIGNAVIRNRVKRLIREALSRLESKIPSGLDLIIIARPGVEAMSLDAIEQSLVHVMKRAKVIRQVPVQNHKRG
ncbi:MULTISPECIES: ribonuclease P protein component [Brevibacillus]|uniref:Ribonuclease P protein component n=1 Tax=Brevibacillus borstelensis AK1 TaxID=1300222 RepID=M8D8W4_9BACL|nr:ribonuclease P protein component [Brevibacillus borstelensis]EMT52694.1 ribonuclease P protein component [Brevibacillus borstelensis AK1]KKX55036.1 ribonuclease P [Brevibacillus borstelensis cifa_chp40]MBE5393825.1 ribonuclease P protein component [Brevibacillus borstelensis]MCC0566723.1 ribonuclease P protein component [Brevibacillus borstelensis]MCM3561262.1 ribonuclease P protein component [Brevibacillus borstelensis]